MDLDHSYSHRPEYLKADEVDMCEICQEPIFEGEAYYYIQDTTICTNCIDDFKKIAEK